MAGNFKKNDLRVIKTQEALLAGLQKILTQRNFGRITVNDICEEAQLSRSAFYAHFQDKYALLERWLVLLTEKLKIKSDSFSEFATTVNSYIWANSKVVVNIMTEANNETSTLVKNFFADMLNLKIKKRIDRAEPHKTPVLCHVCTGGIANWLYWQIDNDFPQDLPFLNADFFAMLQTMLTWGKD